MPRPAYRRVAGVLVPLFSLRSTESWGVGEFRDLGTFSGWMRRAGLSLVQLLPLNEMSAGQDSPYSAMASAALDPAFIAPDGIAEFARAGGRDALPADARDALAAAAHAPQVDFAAVRRAKGAAFALAWDAFRGSDAFDAFRERERHWLDDYALFRALADENGAHGADWQAWAGPIARRDPGAMAEASGRLRRGIDYYAWLQWIADAQWRAARADARANGVAVFGDVPFMVNAASADVWARQDEFMLDASVGTPPDPFSETGQDWGVPVYRWPEIAAGDYEWLRQRGARAASLFDGFRVDHLVGFYRTFVRPKDGEPYFLPGAPHEQIAQGERIMRMFMDTGAAVTAEDLGTVPDYVRESLGRLGLPGYIIQRWHRHWKAEGEPFIPPAEWVSNAVATTGTHDTETLAEYWDTISASEREQLAGSSAGFSEAARDTILASLYHSPSNLLILPIQDLFGWRDRINTPATVGETNWRWALPWPVDGLEARDEAARRAEVLRDLAVRTGRVDPSS
jgi:4-alpha-glucanotransferase